MKNLTQTDLFFVNGGSSSSASDGAGNCPNPPSGIVEDIKSIVNKKAEIECDLADRIVDGIKNWFNGN